AGWAEGARPVELHAGRGQLVPPNAVPTGQSGLLSLAQFQPSPLEVASGVQELFRVLRAPVGAIEAADGSELAGVTLRPMGLKLEVSHTLVHWEGSVSPAVATPQAPSFSPTSPTSTPSFGARASTAGRGQHPSPAQYQNWRGAEFSAFFARLSHPRFGVPGGLWVPRHLSGLLVVGRKRVVLAAQAHPLPTGCL